MNQIDGVMPNLAVSGCNIASKEPHLMPAGRPSKYQKRYCAEMVAYCGQGRSITAFAGKIGVCRDTLTQRGREHTEFSLAIKNAKAAAASWWEENRLCAANVAGSQIRAAIFALKNFAPDDFRDKEEREISGNAGLVAPVINVFYDSPDDESEALSEAGDGIAY